MQTSYSAEIPFKQENKKIIKSPSPTQRSSCRKEWLSHNCLSSLIVWKFLQHLDWVWDATYLNSGFLRPLNTNLIMISLMHKSSYLTRSRDYVRLQGTAPLFFVCHLHSGEWVLVKTHPLLSSSVATQDSLPQASHHTFKNLKHTRGLLNSGRQSYFWCLKARWNTAFILCGEENPIVFSVSVHFLYSITPST